jgi:hypothetical protein
MLRGMFFHPATTATHLFVGLAGDHAAAASPPLLVPLRGGR